VERDRGFGAAAVDEDGDFGDLTLGYGVVSDLGIPGHADQDAAVRRDTVELPRGEGVAADERLADRISGDLHAVGVGIFALCQYIKPVFAEEDAPDLPEYILYDDDRTAYPAEAFAYVIGRAVEEMMKAAAGKAAQS
jgi:hypothetical protein